jgi:hypothetical protein
MWQTAGNTASGDRRVSNSTQRVPVGKSNVTKTYGSL